MRFLPAAAITAGDTVRLETAHEERVEVTVAKVQNGTPYAGRITWLDGDDNPYEIGAAVRVEVVKL